MPLHYSAGSAPRGDRAGHVSQPSGIRRHSWIRSNVFAALAAVTCLALLCVASGTVDALAKAPSDESGESRQRTILEARSAVELPFIDNRVHRVGNLGLNLSNYGYFGPRFDDCLGLASLSLEFPRNSGTEYNFAGGLWVGAVVGEDTVVSLAIRGNSTDGRGFLPRSFPEGAFVTRTTRPVLRQPPNSLCPDVLFSEDAVSEQDLVAVYSDTLGRGLGLGGGGSDATGPVGVIITQKTYSWSTDFASDFVLMDMEIKNVRKDTLKEMYIGVFMDQDVFGPLGGVFDDITGYTHSVPSPLGGDFLDTLNLAWCADINGEPIRGAYVPQSPTGVVGLRVVRAPGNLQFSFNWWTRPDGGAPDWGPQRVGSDVNFATGDLGVPGRDPEHYRLMSNGEFDYPQYEAAMDHTADGWLPPLPNPGQAANMANGTDTRYLLSFGPFTVPPDSILPLTLAFVGGSNFHTDPRNFISYWDPLDPQPWLERLNFDDFALNAIWAGWVYDSPGFDTDGDGYRGKFRIINGDTAFYTGDGIPDYQGPPPPPAPNELRYSAISGAITIRWNGRRTESYIDPFSFVQDFEGYRVYMSRTLRQEDFALIASRDNVNFVRRAYNPTRNRWLSVGQPLSLDVLRELYNDLVDTAGFTSHWAPGTPFHPDSFKVCEVPEALMEVTLNEDDPAKLDTTYYCFTRYGANSKVNDTTTAFQVDSLGHEVVGVIRKVYPYAKPNDSLLRHPDGSIVVHPDGSTTEWPYYEYEYAIDGLQLAEPIFLAVTAFDFGNPAAELATLESSPLANATEIWPINSADVVKRDRPKPGVYPNPYRLADNYNAEGWENARGLEPDPERARQVVFTNIPDTCSISIWSLDGDLVRRIEHASHPSASEASVARWNLITRNTQAVKTGIYIYTIESRFGTDMGKLVIIK